MRWNVVLGPPGTGKTSFGLNLVKEYLQDYNPDQIAYLAFTKKAANVAKYRACRDIPYINEDSIIYFRTIHSLCFRLLAVTSDAMMKKKDWLSIAELLGVDMNCSGLYSLEEISYNQPVGDKLLFLLSLSRLQRRSLEDVYEEVLPPDIAFEQLVQAKNTLDAYKQKYKKLDFIDLLEKWLLKGQMPLIKVLIVDEAQDLSRLQWLVVKRLASVCNVAYAIGDDDQSIFKWAGACTEDFIGLDTNTHTLSKSYRLPEAVYDVGCSILKRIENRVSKTFHSNGDIGTFNRYTNIDDIDISKGKWLLLARNRYQLMPLVKWCELNGFAYHSAVDNFERRNVIKAIRDWNALSQGEGVSSSEMSNVCKFLDVEFKASKKYKHYLSDINISYSPWTKAFVKLNPYIKRILLSQQENGENIHRPRIHINTIHGVKGDECDNVLVMTELSKTSYNTLYERPSEEHRVFYVACTRAHKTLNVVESGISMGYSI